jgi:protein ImuB
LDPKTICVRAPWFRTELEARARPDWAGLPLAVYRPRSRHRELLEVSPGATSAGLTAGMPFKEAQIRCPETVFVPDDPPKYEQAFLRILDLLDRFSPVVEDAGPGLAFIDATGLEPLYGPDLELCRKVQTTVKEDTGHRVHVGLAGSRFAAEIAARTADAGGVAAALETDAEYLAKLPLEMLPLPEKATAQLSLLGVRDLGEFARLPGNTVRAKYGEEGRAAQKLAAGRDDRPLKPRSRPLVLEEKVEFEWDEHNLDRITFALQALADRLARRLEIRGLMARRMQAEIIRTDQSRQTFTLDLPEPSAQARTFRDLVRWHLDAAETTAIRPEPGSIEATFESEPGISTIRIEVAELVPFEGKATNLFANRAERIQRANRAISRLRVALGEEVVFRSALHPGERAPERAFARIDAYVPEAGKTRRKKSAQGTDEGRRKKSGQGAGKERKKVNGPEAPPAERYAAGSGGSLRLFDPPLAATLLSDRTGERIRFDGRHEAIVGRYGPHRLRSGWWETPLTRDYYRVLLAGGDGLLVYHEPPSDRWFVQGVVD